MGQERLTVKIARQMTDSGGGGTLESVVQELRLLGVANVLVYIIGSCTLHLLQLALSTYMKKVYGDGGRGILNVMQLLHSCYNLCNNHETGEIRLIWLDVCDELNIQEAKYKTVQAPILTWWSTVFAATVFVKEHWNIFVRIACMTCNKAKTKKDTLYQITDAIEDLTTIPEIYNDLLLLVALHKNWFNCHFEWLQGSDDGINGSQPGFLMRHIGVRFFIMHDELQDILQTYNTTHHGFDEFRNNLDSFSPELRLVQLRKGSDFLRLSMASIKRHFKRYL